MTGFLLDTNVPSELMRPHPEPRVMDWMAAQDVSKLFMSVVSIGELEGGLASMPNGKRRMRLEASLERFLSNLPQQNILPLTRVAAARWGKLEGMRQMAGRPLSAPDGMIAATALELGLTVVTRNTKDFHALGVSLFNPWGNDAFEQALAEKLREVPGGKRDKQYDDITEPGRSIDH